MDFKNFENFINETTEGFSWGNQANKAFLKNIVNYFGSGETIYDRSKGLFVRGNYGVGKTIIFKLIQKWLPSNRKFAYNPTNDVVSIFNSEGDKAIERYKFKKERMFDDLGSEEIGVHYGNRIETFQKIIYSRYDNFQSKGIRTHFTTNLTNDELKKKYDERAYDRIKEMCNVFNWPENESKRGKIEFSMRKPVEVIEKKDIELIPKDQYERILAYQKDHGTLPEWGPMQYVAAYIHAIDNQLVERNEEDVIAFAKQCRDEVEERIKLDKNGAMNQFRMNLLNDKKSFANHCREKAIRKHFKSIK